MSFFQPEIKPLGQNVNMEGQTAIVTGATSGIGLEISRQFLLHKVSTLILAIRNIAKGESIREALLSEPAIKSANPNATVKVLKLDMEDYQLCKEFARSVIAEHAELHVLMLNAGVGYATRHMSPNGHERNVTINYLANVLLLIELLPLLESTAERFGKPTRVSITGSRMAEKPSFEKKAPLQPGETIFGHLKDSKNFFPVERYSDSKLLVVLFLRELAKHRNSEKVIVNTFCPGMVDTAFTSNLPIQWRIPMKIVKALRARSVDKVGPIALNAALVAGPESHGAFLGDMEILE
jgi:NAD(P)-dependent dehydrogenase (short-subunit alcohol dehydrogenase family)